MSRPKLLRASKNCLPIQSVHDCRPSDSASVEPCSGEESALLNGKNNFADAVIIELYGQIVANGKGRRVFVKRTTRRTSACRPGTSDCLISISRTISRALNLAISSNSLTRCGRCGPSSSRKRCTSHEFSMEPRTATEISEAIAGALKAAARVREEVWQRKFRALLKV